MGNRLPAEVVEVRQNIHTNLRVVYSLDYYPGIRGTHEYFDIIWRSGILLMHHNLSIDPAGWRRKIINMNYNVFTINIL